MSTLLLYLPPRSRLRAQGRSIAGSELPAGSGESAREYDYLLSTDGAHVSHQGRVRADKLPPAELVIAIPAESDLGWQKVTLPRAGRQMRSALAGLLEESLLDDPESLHFAIAPTAVGGDEAWVAVTSRAWLAQQLTELEAANVFVDRVTPLSWPGEPPRGHFYETGLPASPLALRWSFSGGVSNLSLEGGLARQLLQPALVQDARWSATPAVAAQAEEWLGAPLTVLTPEQRALAVIDSNWDLRQFELAQRTRGIRAVRNVYRGFMRRNWRPVRLGLAGLVIVQLLGLNVLAWQQNHQLQQRREAVNQTLTRTFPQIRVPLNAPIQMRREADALRASAGRPGDQDLEILLAAAASAWPSDRGPVDALSFEPGRLVLSGNGWNDEQIQRLRTQLGTDGWALDSAEGHLTLHRTPRQAERQAGSAGASQIGPGPTSGGQMPQRN